MNTMDLRTILRSSEHYVEVFAKWVFLSGLVGLMGGFIGAAFYKAVAHATAFRLGHPEMIYLLPFAGLVITGLYRLFQLKNDPGTNIIIKAIIEEDRNVPIRMAFLIFVGTVITHLFGGSVGRESAALQIGGCFGSAVGQVLKLDDQDMKLITMCGMSALFSAVFGTPIAATVFVIEFISIGIMHYSALVPCLTASAVAHFTAIQFGAEAEVYTIVETTAFAPIACVKVLVLGVVCAVVGICFCFLLHKVSKLLKQYGYNDYVRILGGGTLIMCLTVLTGCYDYNGSGTAVIEQAIAGKAVWYAFLLKMIFTAVTLGSGYKGGEIVPSFFIGSTMGCVVGPLLGLPASLSAAMGLIGVFCAVVNCPMASIIMSIELFGSENLPFFAIICAVSYMLSGPFSLYSSQRILYSKLEPRYVRQETM